MLMIQTQINILINFPYKVRHNPLIVTKVWYHIFPFIEGLKDKNICQLDILNAIYQYKEKACWWKQSSRKCIMDRTFMEQIHVSTGLLRKKSLDEYESKYSIKRGKCETQTFLFQTRLVLALNNTMKQKEDGSGRGHLASGPRALRNSPVNMPPDFLSCATQWQCLEPNLSVLTPRPGLHLPDHL